MIYEAIKNAIIEGEDEDVSEMVQKLIDEGEEPLEIINKSLMPGMDVVGQMFKEGEMFVPEVLASAQAMTAGVELVKPLLVGDNSTKAGTVIIGTVMGDLHDLGKNLVGMMLESNGFEVINLGADISPKEFVEAAVEYDAQIIGMSALLTTTMKNMEATIKEVEEAGLNDKVKVMVGGAPVTRAYSESIGATAFSADALEAVDTAKQLVNA